MIFERLVHAPTLAVLAMGFFVGCNDDPVDTDVEGDDTEDPVDLADSIEGSLTYQSSIDGVTVCDAEIAISGDEYAGDCAGCDFVFSIDSTVTADNGTSDCELHPIYSLVPNSSFGDLQLGFWSTYDYYGYFYQYNYLQVGFSYNYYGYKYPGPYWWGVAYDGSYYGSATLNGDTLTWNLDYVGYDYLDNYGQDCNTWDVAAASDGDQAGDEGTDDLSCDGDKLDVWTFTATAGGTAEISVDTVAAETAFDPAFWIVDPDGCDIGYGDEEFECVFAGESDYYGLCPSLSIDDTSEGTYQVVIMSWDACIDDEDPRMGSYKILVDVGGDSALTQSADDVDGWTLVDTEAIVAGSATITEN